jgi:hypothetical protein
MNYSNIICTLIVAIPFYVVAYIAWRVFATACRLLGPARQKQPPSDPVGHLLYLCDLYPTDKEWAMVKLKITSSNLTPAKFNDIYAYAKELHSTTVDLRERENAEFLIGITAAAYSSITSKVFGWSYIDPTILSSKIMANRDLMKWLAPTLRRLECSQVREIYHEVISSYKKKNTLSESEFREFENLRDEFDPKTS